MDIKEVKVKLEDIRRSTGTKNPKVLIYELCAVVSFLLNEIGRIKNPPVAVLQQTLPENIEIIKRPTVEPPWPDQPKKPQFPSPAPSVLPPLRRRRSAGDAE